MPFLPTNTILNTVNEKENLEHTITYTDSFGVSFPVTITPSLNNPTVTVSGNKIFGFYTDVFPESISYRTEDDRFVTVDSFEDIKLDELYGIYYFKASVDRRFTYTYTAEANGETQVYTIIVENDWTEGRDELLRFFEKETRIVSWVNNSGDIVIWVNRAGSSVNWNNE